MCAVKFITLLAALASITIPAAASGRLFNRFSPEMLANMGYGGYGVSQYRVQPYLQHMNNINGYLSEDGEGEQDLEEPCYGKRCTANEHCCPGSVCVEVDGGLGTCLFAYGRKIGELCSRDNDCESGLLCAGTDAGEPRVCKPPMSTRKQYGKECSVSAECDLSRGLCCQVQKRHRQVTRQICSYYEDSQVCIGPIATDLVARNNMEHTAGEKRITSYRHLLH